MKAKFEFDFFAEDCRDQKELHQLMVSAPTMSVIIWELDQELRKITKYKDEAFMGVPIESVQDFADKLRGYLHEKMTINLMDL